MTVELDSDRREDGRLSRRYFVQNHRAGLYVRFSILNDASGEYYTAGEFVIARYDLIKSRAIKRDKKAVWIVCWAPKGKIMAVVVEPHIVEAMHAIKVSMSKLLAKMSIPPRRGR